MPESQGITADGTAFAYRTSAAGITPIVWGDLGEVVSITPPAPSRSSVDFTHLKSPDKTREFKPSMKDSGEASLTLHYTPATRLKIDTLFASDEIQSFQITYPDGATETFSGFLTGKPTEGIEVEGKVTINCPIKVSGMSVYAEAE